MLAVAMQSFGGAQAIPCTQATHIPLPLHTPPGQPIPAATLLDAVHIGPPLVHETVPFWHGLPREHPEPELHATQVPDPLQTPPGHPDPGPTFDVT